MNLRKNDGFAGIDILISLIIILIFITTGFGTVYNIGKTNNSVKRKTTAVTIATDILDKSKSLEYENVSLEEGMELANYLTSSEYVLIEDGTYRKRINNTNYNVAIDILDYRPSQEDTESLVKTIKVKVTYPVGNSTESIDISTVIQKI